MITTNNVLYLKVYDEDNVHKLWYKLSPRKNIDSVEIVRKLYSLYRDNRRIYAVSNELYTVFDVELVRESKVPSEIIAKDKSELSQIFIHSLTMENFENLLK